MTKEAGFLKSVSVSIFVIPGHTLKCSFGDVCEREREIEREVSLAITQHCSLVLLGRTASVIAVGTLHSSSKMERCEVRHRSQHH